MKICIITKDLTVEPKIGFALHVHNLAKWLGKKHEVTVLSFGGMITKKQITALEKNVKIIEIPDLFSLLLGGLTYKLFRKPTLDYFLSLSARHNSSFKELFNKIVATSDVVIFEGCWHAPVLRFVSAGKMVIYNAHNIEFALKKQVYTDFFTKRLLLERVYKIEKEMVQRADYIFALSPADKINLVETYHISPEKIIVNYTFAVDVPGRDYDRRNASPKTVAFIGSTYFANIEAARFINENLAGKLPDYEFHIIGKAGNHIALPRRNVHIHGYVSKKEKDKILQQCGIAIAPIFHGGGICGKIIEYMAYGLPVICTPLAFKGLGVPEELVILADRNNFQEKIKNCSPYQLKVLSRKGREYFLSNRTPEILIREWENLLVKGVSKK
ncbi:MAG: glycosyltransferase [Thermoplasmata archaeon]